MKISYPILFCLLLTGCIGASTNFTNRSVTYQLTPSIDGKQNSINEQPKIADATVNAEKTFDTDTNANVAKEQTVTNPVKEETKPIEQKEEK